MRIICSLPARIQGDQAACPKPPVDIDVKVAFQCKILTLKRNFQIKSTGGFGQAAMSPCIREGKVLIEC